MPRHHKQPTARAPSAPIHWPRADPQALARFDPHTKTCSMNCGPSSDDPRSRAERKFLCPECYETPQGGSTMPETITLQVFPIAEQMPDADTDVILFDGDPSGEGFLGAYIDHAADGSPVFVDAHGATAACVTHYCELPRRALRREGAK